MKKILLIGLVVCVLAIGGIGAAFATGMNNSGSSIGILSEGNFTLDQINLTGVAWPDASMPDGSVWTQWANLYFDKNLSAGASIWLKIFDGSNNIIYSAEATGLFASNAGDPVKFIIANGGHWLDQGAYVKPDGTINPPPQQWVGAYYLWKPAQDLWYGLPVSQIYKIDVEVQD
jgi:hypothetical protein